MCGHTYDIEVNRWTRVNRTSEKEDNERGKGERGNMEKEEGRGRKERKGRKNVNTSDYTLVKYLLV